MRPRTILFIVAAIAIAGLTLVSVADQFFVDFLWFSSLGYERVFATIVKAQVAVFAVVWAAAFLAIAASAFAALRLSHERERLHVVRRSDEMIEVNLPELLRAFGDRVPWTTLAIAAAAILAIFPAQGEAASWDIYLKAIYAVPFGVLDQAFGRDVGFYVLTLPMLEEIRDLLLVIIMLAAAVALGIYWIRGALDFRESPPRISPAAAAHISVLLAFFFLQRAFSYWISRYLLLLQGNGVVFGLRYVDNLLWRPGLWLLVALSIVAAVICLANVNRNSITLPLVGLAIVFGPSIALGFVAPVIEKIWVKPDELRIERPYLVRNIEMTRHAYNLDGVDIKPFAGLGTLKRASLEEDAPTVKNIRIWDPRPLLATYRQLQEIRLYYDFGDVDIDRYWINGEYTQVMLSPRELNVSLLPENAQTWVNRHLKFTHGSGLVMSPVNRKDNEGLPIFYLKNIPP
ncbi:MAG TPA: UPF0182 family protein, partial [Candidatus Binataceae bacterium]|nr:UPF0182 family protein [Candidatus Binataceae bacterium]